MRSVLHFLGSVLFLSVLSGCDIPEPSPSLVEPTRLSTTLSDTLPGLDVTGVTPTRTPRPGATPHLVWPTNIPAGTDRSAAGAEAVVPEPPVPPAICSPLEGIPIEALVEITSNPYQPSRTGKDDGHPALDFAFYNWSGLEDIDGHTVQAVLAGTVAAIGYDRLPYGNMVIIETNLETLPAGVQDKILADPGSSVYILYAHFRDAPDLSMGDPVACAQPIGQAGKTGRSGAPHLHLEVRLGPPGMVFSPMVFYDTRAKEDEMDRYRLWSMNGEYASLDPNLLLANPDQP